MENLVNALPSVSVIIPCRNEKKYIRECLDSIISNDYPKQKLEILIVDGKSEDGTREILDLYAVNHTFIKVFTNDKRIIPAAMNIGIINSTGDIIMKMDGHASYCKNYISKCVDYSMKYDAENVGGVWNVMPREDTITSKSIAIILKEKFGSGNAYIKIGAEKPMWTDCVSFGCFKKEVFSKIGLFNEDLVRASDMDLNKRIKKAGGRILLAPEIVNNYYCDANFRSFWKHNYSDGVWTTHVIKFKSMAFSLRHLIPLGLVLSLSGSLLLSLFISIFLWVFLAILSVYVSAAIIVSLKIFFSGTEKNIKYLYTLPFAFFVRHFAHGIGALYGFLKPKKSN